MEVVWPFPETKLFCMQKSSSPRGLETQDFTVLKGCDHLFLEKCRGFLTTWKRGLAGIHLRDASLRLENA